MKKQIMTVLSAAAAASLLASGIAAAPAVDGRKTCEAYIADVKLDGKVDEVWKYAPEIKVDTVKQNASAWYGDTSLTTRPTQRGKDSEASYGWSDSIDKASSDPSVYGQCLLSDVSVADLIAAEKAAAEASKAPATADPIALMAASCAAAFAGIAAFRRRK